MPETRESPSQQAVIRNLLKRREEMASGGAVSGDRKFGLVVEGGAMRGIISGAALLALSELGLLEAFDEVYGTSAGAINGAYALAGQSALGLTIYTEDIISRRFINLVRWRRIVDLDFLFDEVIGRRKPLRVDRVRSARPRLHVSVTDVASGEGVFFDGRRPDIDLVAVLRAGAAMPVLDNRPVVIEGRRYFDGGIALSIPVEKALADGCTDVLALLTRPAGYSKQPSGHVVRWVERRALAGFGKGFQGAYFRRYLGYNRSLDLLFGRTDSGTGANLAVIGPRGGDTKVERLTRDPARLRAAAVEAVVRTARCFGAESAEIVKLVDAGRRPGRV